MELREMAAAWLRANRVRADAQQEFLRRLDVALKHGASCTFTLGKRLSGKPRLVCCFRGEFFAFDLTPEQAARLKIGDASLRCAESLNREVHTLVLEPSITLEEVVVEQAAALSHSLPIRGTVRYRSTRTMLEPIVLRVVCEPSHRRGTILNYYLLSLLAGEGKIPFSLNPPVDPLDSCGKTFTGPVPLFFQIWTTQAKPLSSPPWPHGRPSPFSKPDYFAAAGFHEPASPPALAVTERPLSDVRAVLVEIV